MNQEQSSPHTPICAIGASAGGVAALQAFFRHIPSDLGLAYVVIIHLAPDHPSALSEVLSNATQMPVQQVDDAPLLEPNKVYVIPPDRELVIEGNNVRSRPFSEPRGRRAPIDMFFRSVGQARGDGMAVVLSGAGSDGAVGIKAVKESGGIIFVQEPRDAEYPMMPRAAIASETADFVGPIPRLVERIADVARSKDAVASLSPEREDQTLQRLIAFVRSRTGHDFSSYKRATVMRRVKRRMQVTRNRSLGDYADYVVANPEEAQQLFGDLLISVTAFFRDSDAFDALAREAIPTLLEDADAEVGIRIWVVGCATGEEAYSVAILCLEEAERRHQVLPIQVFATDLDDGALATAREGRYPLSIEADVSEERLNRFFVREGAHYRIKKDVRDTVLFASHSVIKDPPFMRLDLISCRNLLIYLARDLQGQALALLAYGLKPNGFLFLGSAETTDAAPDFFSTVAREARIYRLRPQAARRMPVVSQFPPEHRPAVTDRPRQEQPTEHELMFGSVHLEALERSAPPSVLVDRDHMVLNLSPNAGRFLLPLGGPLSSDIALLVRPELRLDLRTALRRAIDDGVTSITPVTPVAFNGSRHRVSMYVAPAPEKKGEPAGEALVLFLDHGSVDETAAARDGEDASGEVQRLREALNVAETRLGASKIEYENAIQDLRVANEELQSINEEYRSTSEELETSKEELQSMNEELQTVNAELKSKLESIGAAHSDLENLVSSTDIGTLFLDPELRIRMFTPAITEFFNVADGDVGRAITNFTSRLDYRDLAADASRVVKELTTLEREIQTGDGRWLMMRMRPYRTTDARITGTVMTFVDITERLMAKKRLGESEERLRALVNATSDVIYRMAPDWTEMRVLEGRGFLAEVKQPLARWPENYLLPEDQTEVWETIEEAIRKRTTFQLEHRVRKADGTIGWTLSRAVPILDDDGEIVEWFGAASDVTARRQAEENLRAARDALALATDASQLGWGVWDFARGTVQWDARGREIFGLRENQTTIDDWLERVHPADRDRLHDELAASAAQGRAFDCEYRVVDRNGNVVLVHGTGMFEKGVNGQPVGGTGLVRDVTELRRWEESQSLLVSELNHRVKNMLTVVVSIARQTQRTSPNTAAFIESFEARIQALSRAHSLLTQQNWTAADLRDLVDEVTSSLIQDDRERISIDGPRLLLSPNATLTFALALHELGTNALKHGAWSKPGGRVDVAWRTETDGRVAFEWSERGGPEVRPPERTGFGARLLERGIAGELDGEVTIDYSSSGLRCLIEFKPEDPE